jgi:flavin-dependent dehydrogenase
MRVQHPIAIVGGGPAGALAGGQLATGGRKVLLFDEKLAWEKPCGGGLTHKALQRYPFLAEAGSDSNPVEYCELISPSGRRVRFQMEHPVSIVSRLALNGSLLKRARQAGGDVRQERVTRIERTGEEWKLTTTQGHYQASYVILAGGARNSFRSQFLPPISPSDLMVAAGYFIPGRSSLMQIQFLKGITGYIWVFPRADHVSAGIACKLGETSTSELRRILERWLEEHWLEDVRNEGHPEQDRQSHKNAFRLKEARFYSHILPSFRSQTLATLEVCGEGWAMIGDSAGLVDPITGEGLYCALRSAELCADALLLGRPHEYRARLEQEILPELRLAARVSRRFYSGRIFGDSVLERMVSLTAQSAAIRDLMSDLFAGNQGYRDLRARLYRILPLVVTEVLTGSLRRLWRSGNKKASEFITHPLAE